MFCKNCGDNTKGKYCQNCGQKTDTHRLSVRHFLAHDLLHGLFHLDRGLPRTLKEILIEPGATAWNYINGKRKRYYSFFYLLLILIGIYLYLKSFSSEIATQVEDAVEGPRKDVNMSLILKDYTKLVIFIYIPMFALSAFLIFRKLKLNFVEFCIPAAISTIGISIILIVSEGTDLIADKLALPKENLFIKISGLIYFLALQIFPCFTFYQFIKNNYSNGGILYRVILFYILCALIIFGTLFLIAFIKTGRSSIELIL